MRSSFHKTWHAVEVCTNGSLDYLPYHHVRALTKSFFFSDTEPTAAVEKVPNSPYEFLEVNDIDLGRNPRPRPRLREPNAESSLTSFWLFNTIIREGRNIPAFEYSNDLHWRDFFFGGGGGDHYGDPQDRTNDLTHLPTLLRIRTSARNSPRSICLHFEMRYYERRQWHSWPGRLLLFIDWSGGMISVLLCSFVLVLVLDSHFWKPF